MGSTRARRVGWSRTRSSRRRRGSGTPAGLGQLCMLRPSRFSTQSSVYAPLRGDGPIWASHGHTSAAGAPMPIARVYTPLASSRSSSPGSRDATSLSVAPPGQAVLTALSGAFWAVASPASQAGSAAPFNGRRCLSSKPSGSPACSRRLTTARIGRSERRREQIGRRRRSPFGALNASCWQVWSYARRDRTLILPHPATDGDPMTIPSPFPPPEPLPPDPLPPNPHEPPSPRPGPSPTDPPAPSPM